jgi:hypothetical protein
VTLLRLLKHEMPACTRPLFYSRFCYSITGVRWMHAGVRLRQDFVYSCRHCTMSPHYLSSHVVTPKTIIQDSFRRVLLTVNFQQWGLSLPINPVWKGKRGGQM